MEGPGVLMKTPGFFVRDRIEEAVAVDLKKA
jgi:hypothetical protein